jgi:hypothetical protein
MNDEGQTVDSHISSPLSLESKMLSVPADQMRFRRLLLPLSVAVFAGGPAFAASTPFFENFDAAATGTTLPADFIESGPAGGTVNYSVEIDGEEGGNDLQASITGVTATETSGQGI